MKNNKSWTVIRDARERSIKIHVSSSVWRVVSSMTVVEHSGAGQLRQLMRLCTLPMQQQMQRWPHVHEAAVRHYTRYARPGINVERWRRVHCRRAAKCTRSMCVCARTVSMRLNDATSAEEMLVLVLAKPDRRSREWGLLSHVTFAHCCDGTITYA